MADGDGSNDQHRNFFNKVMKLDMLLTIIHGADNAFILAWLVSSSDSDVQSVVYQKR